MIMIMMVLLKNKETVMAINLETKNKKLNPISFKWNFKDVILYNMGVGASELDFTWENQLKVLPTFAIVPAFPALGNSVPIIGGNLFTLLHGEQSIEILNPKIKGSLYLDHTTQNDNLDFLVFFSSISSILGSLGQTDYASGNSFLDSFAELRESWRKAGKRKGKTISINWP